jgi:hypothetical protein
MTQKEELRLTSGEEFGNYWMLAWEGGHEYDRLAESWKLQILSSEIESWTVRFHSPLK